MEGRLNRNTVVGIVSRRQATSGGSYQNRPEEDILLLFQNMKVGFGANLVPYSLDNFGASPEQNDLGKKLKKLPPVVEFKNG